MIRLIAEHHGDEITVKGTYNQDFIIGSPKKTIWGAIKSWSEIATWSEEISLNEEDFTVTHQFS